MSTSQVDLECAYNILSLQTNSLSSNQSGFLDGDDFLQESNFLSLDDDFQESSFFALDDDFQESSDKQSSLLNDVQKSSDNQSIDDQSSDNQSINDQSSDNQSSLSNDSSLAIEGLSSEISTIDLSQTKAGAKNQEEPNSK